jgi:hypothetical protein
MKAVSLAALGIVSLLGVTACSSSAPKSSPASSDVTTADSGSVPVGVTGTAVSATSAASTTTAPPSKECIAFNAAKSALSGDRTTLGNLPAEYSTLADSYKTLSTKAPSELKADFTVVVTTYSSLSLIATSAGGDINKFKNNADANKLINDTKFTASIAKVTVYTDKTCPKQ